MRQHKYCMHSIKKIGACRKRKKKKKKACQQVTSAPRDLLLHGTAAFIICGSRAAARPSASPCPPRRSGCPGGVSARQDAGGGSGRGWGGPCGRPSLLLMGWGGGGQPSRVVSGESRQTGARGVGGCGGLWKTGGRF